MKSSVVSRWLRRMFGAGLPSVPARPAPAHGFHRGSYGDEHGMRPYKLFVPVLSSERAMPLVVMLHGCRQDPDDFATGTRMNLLAEQRGWLVLYPQQPPRHNAYRCWNWFLTENQRRGGGEAALIAGLTRHVMATHRVDADRVFVAGLSAGGALTAILAREYADVYAAAGIFAGLPQGAAHSTASAITAMKHGDLSRHARPDVSAPGAPVIVFHGDADTTVNPRHARQIVDDALGPLKADAQVRSRAGTDAGRRVTHSTWLDTHGRNLAELWEIQGAGHAWSGGSADGSYADAAGPDASREMLRFFEQHPRRIAR